MAESDLHAQSPFHPPNVWDLIALSIIFIVFALLAMGAQQMASPYAIGDPLPISLAPEHLPNYALRTVMRMGCAITLSLLFSIIFGTLAAKYRYAERIIIPAIDIAQSLPVLGFLSITIVGFIQLFPGSLLGPECAAIFAIFTSQAWNIALSVYQSLKTLPDDLIDAAKLYRLTAWQRFWRVEIPFAAPGLLWNTMISLSGGWFFVVACEAISVSNQHIMLPGIGSYISLAIEQKDMMAIGLAILTMFFIILIYDQLIFRPLLKWSEKFNTDDNLSEEEATSWVYTLFKRTRWVQKLSIVWEWLQEIFIHGFSSAPKNKPSKISKPPLLSDQSLSLLFNSLLCFLTLATLVSLVFVLENIPLTEVFEVAGLGFITGLRVMIMTALCALIWIPVGVWVGFRPRARRIVQPIAQFLAAFPANLLFPIVVYLIVRFELNVEIWTTPLMVLGTQWYILFNVIAGTAALPKDLCFAAQNLGVKGFLWWKRLILPAIFPYFITGALAAAGGAWNASIVAEVVNWGDTTLTATGLGAYITEQTASGDFARITLGISMMCIYVLLLNRFFWQRLYDHAASRYRME